MDIRTRKFIGMAGATLGVTLLAVASVYLTAPQTPSFEDIPLPFGGGTTSDLSGAVSTIGRKNSIEVKKVTFPTGTDIETLTGGAIYLLRTPDESAVIEVALDTAINGGQPANYFGYKYTSASATTEKANRTAATLAERFPGRFFASQQARDEDAANGDVIARFESGSSITMEETATLSGVTLTRNSLYLLVINETGAVTFRARSLAVCGNGVIQSGEQCDDGNIAAADGCSDTCTTEAGFTCTGEPSVCSTIVCGNGIVQPGESCDDGNASNTDACTNSCANAACGDTFVQTGVEQCDDGNQSNTDSCTNVCEDAACGDGFMQGTEECDDGNQIDTDSCTNTCQAPVCGDGSIEGAEVCDDGNTATGDGCSDFCSVENGFACTGAPSSCTVVQDPGLIIVAQNLPATGTGAPFENKLIARFTATATGGTALIHIDTVRLRAVQGLGVAMGPFVVGRDENSDGVVSESETASPVTPIRAGETDVTIPLSQSVAVGTTVLFEIYGQFFSDPIDPVKFEFASIDIPGQGLITAQTYISAQTAESEALAGIDTDGSNPSADIHVTTYTGTLWTLVNICGNGLTEQHQCDDGNQVSGDGCSSACAIESGYVCSGEPSVCTVLVCGDGLIQGPEECDDGNTADTDGCSQSCTIEAGFFCSGQPSTCAPSGG
jgi:cysteine-rich repeat protein